MTRELAKTLIPILQGFIEGKTIQFRGGSDWRTLELNEGWGTFENYEWRIKPEPREFWLGLHHDSDFSCAQVVKCSQGPKPDKCDSSHVIKVREVLE
jgi:hypothetical protein